MSDVIVPSAVQMLEVAPCFQVPDLMATAEHYRDLLGFSIQPHDGRSPSVCLVSRDGIAIMLQQVDGAERRTARAGVEPIPDAYVWVTDLASLAGELRERGADILIEPLAQPSGTSASLWVRDIDGRVLCFAELDD